MKYVIFEELGNSFPVDFPIVIFPDMIEHSLIAKSIGGKVTGAGFVDMDQKNLLW